MKFDSQVSELGFSTSVPKNLRSAAESFKLQYARESGTTTTPDYADSMAWAELNTKLSGYAARLQLIEEQQRFEQKLITFLYLAAAISMATFSILGRRSANKDRPN